MKIIFLDIDGVLSTHKQYMMNKKKFWDENPVAKELKIPYPFDPKCVKTFNEVLDETGSEIVLSSDWKQHWNISDLDRIFKFNGVNKSPIDLTTNDVVSFGNIVRNRAYQIGDYIQKNNLTNYVVIDDLNISSFMSITDDQDKFVLTDDFEGIKKLSLKNKIIKILNNG